MSFFYYKTQYSTIVKFLNHFKKEMSETTNKILFFNKSKIYIVGDVCIFKSSYSGIKMLFQGEGGGGEQ